MRLNALYSRQSLLRNPQLRPLLRGDGSARCSLAGAPGSAAAWVMAFCGWALWLNVVRHQDFIVVDASEPFIASAPTRAVYQQTLRPGHQPLLRSGVCWHEVTSGDKQASSIRYSLLSRRSRPILNDRPIDRHYPAALPAWPLGSKVVRADCTMDDPHAR